MRRDGLVVLILGGYGTFGGRLASLLADEERLTLVIAGRSRERAAAFCRTLRGPARSIPASIDRAGIADRLADVSPDIVVDATGPFQAYGADAYGVVEACLAHGVHYLDLADGSRFVEGIVRFDGRARAAGVAILPGMSSFPVLTVAVVDHLAQDLSEVRTVTGGIAPSPFAGVGPNVIRAIAGYAGQPVRLRRDGVDRTGYALTESLDYTIAPPGLIPLKPTRFSLVDVPDLRILPRRHPSLSDVWMGAGPVPEILHRALNALSWLVRLRLLPSLTFLAPLIDRVVNVVRWGEHRGGMFVSVQGLDTRGIPVERTWHMIAEGADGPLIPSMAAEAIVRNALAGRWPEAGARAGDGALGLHDYAALFARRAIRSGIRRSEEGAAGRPLYRRLLGEAWDGLPATLRDLHGAGTRSYRGRAHVERGTGLAARLVARLFRLPAAGADVPLTVDFAVVGAGEVWRRAFSGRVLQSRQWEGTGRWAHLLVERFGPVSVGLALLVEGETLRLVVRRWSLFGLPMPRALAPNGDTFETERDGRFTFHAEIGHPLTGRIVRYRGWLVPVDAATEADPAFR